MAKTDLSLGGNLGEPRANLAAALRMIGDHEHIRVIAASALYETTPQGVTGQPDYLNAVVRAETGLSPEALLAVCQQIETRLGRERHERWGARTVDIDLLTYDARQIAQERLTLPHPRMAERAFVQIPLRELTDGWIEWTDEVRPYDLAWSPHVARTPRWVHRTRTGSTNDDAKQLAAAGLPAWSVVLAEEQTAGRGRWGRTWQSAAGAGLWMSVLLRPEPAVAARAGLLPLATGLAVARVLRDRGIQAELKWPNDVLCNGRKICGILCEAVSSGSCLTHIVVGIGLNLRQTAADFAAQWADTATSVALENPRLAAIERLEVAAALLSELRKAVTMMVTETDRMLARYHDWSTLPGKTITVTRRGGDGRLTQSWSGIVRGFSADGALELETARGLIELASGEVTLRPAGGI